MFSFSQIVILKLKISKVLSSVRFDSLKHLKLLVVQIKLVNVGGYISVP